jgi:membrane-bound metal-dependent hydrolase YbcI (DUF457 family)
MLAVQSPAPQFALSKPHSNFIAAMAGFKTHITVSTTLGVAYGVAGVQYGDMPVPVGVLAGALCSVSGMLPDLDSDSGVPIRESLAFAAAAVPMLMVPRWRTLDFSPETMVMAGCIIYLAIRFGVGLLLKKYTVHRGMFHSIPAAIIATEVAFLVYAREDITLRYFVSFAVLLGFCSHLLLDEIWSVGVKRGQIALKKSFGTAFKLWSSNSLWANFSCYAKLVLLSYLVLHDPVWMYNDQSPTQSFQMIAQRFVDRLKGNQVANSKDYDDLPPMREIPRSQLEEQYRFENEREQPYSHPAQPQPYQDRFGRNSNWQEQEYSAPAPPPRFRDHRSEEDRWLYQR